MGKTESEQLFKPDLYVIQKIVFFVYSIFGILLLALMLHSCANKGVITGGEKDTIPPVMVSTVPIDQSLNYKGNQILLTFDERIQATQLKRKLLITPFTDSPYKVKVNKNTILLTFDEPFADSTTYTINFSDAIGDVTENNPGKNVVVAFSTWHIIDSLEVFGKVVNLLSNQPIEAASVSIYKSSDTLDIFSGKPYYYAITDESGSFHIQNMRSGLYRIYAFQDKNSNYLNESRIEPHGFISDTINLDNISDSLIFQLVHQDVQPLKLVNSKANGNHFDVRYNKYIKNYDFKKLDSNTDSLPSIITADNQVIRFYQQQPILDSLRYLLIANDSVGNTREDTVYVKFTASSPSIRDLKITLNPPHGSSITEHFELILRFNKPIKLVNSDSIFIQYDTLRSDPIDSAGRLNWNFNNTQLTITAQVEPDYLQNQINQFKINQDSLTRLDSLNGVLPDSTMKKVDKRSINPYKIGFYAGVGSFISVEEDSSKLINSSYEFKVPSKFGKISGEILIDSTFFIVQLIDENYKTINQLTNEKKYLFDYIKPGKYNIRVLVDSNHDGIWSLGNIKKNLMPDAVYFNPTFIEIRENWEINNINLTID